MEINYTLVIVATVVQFVLGAIWYGPLFGKAWMKIVGAENCTEEDMKKAQKQMAPFYLLQLIVTFVSTWILAMFIGYISTANVGLTAYCVAWLVWLGFLLPNVISGVIWSGTKRNLQFKQIAILGVFQLIAIMVSAWILMM